MEKLSLPRAVLKRQPKLIRALLAAGQYTALHTAVRLRCPDTTKLLLDLGADPNAKTICGSNPLHIACAEELPCKKALMRLRNAAFDVKLKPKGRKNILVIVKLLLKAGTNVNLRDHRKNTPLQYACFKSNLDVMKVLIDTGADINTKNLFGLTPVHNALVVVKSVDVLKLLLDSKANVNVRNKNALIPLHLAIWIGNIVLIKMLIDSGSNINARDAHNSTSLHIATTKSNNMDLYKLLVKAGANVQAKDTYNYTPFHTAVMHSRNCNILKFLLDSGCNVNEKSVFNGCTPLHEAVQTSRNISMVNFLLKSGADVNSVTNSKNTPLHIAVSYSNSNIIVKKLLESGVNICAKNDKGSTPLHCAASNSNNVNILKILLKYCAKLNEEDKLGNTAVHYAILKLKLSNLEFLVKAGANLNANNPNNDVTTPLQMACCLGNSKILKLLIKSGADITQLIYRNNEVTFAYFIECLKIIIKNENKYWVEDIFKYMIESFDINLVDDNEDDILTKILKTGFLPSETEFFYKMIAEHVSKLKILNFDVSNVLDWFSKLNGFDLSEHFFKCEEELKKAKSTRLHNSWVKFLNLLVDDDHKLVKFAGNEDLINDFKRTDLNKTFPIFGEKMKDNVNKGIYKRKLYDSAAKQLSYCFPMLDSNHLIIRDTLNILSDEDWKKLSLRKRMSI